MNPGRKILNLRCDRKISQQDLARACDITPSALSKIEAGINSPRANIIWRIAKNLGVTIEYLLDEDIPYPFSASSYRQELFKQDVDPSSRVRSDITREEKMFLDAVRALHPIAREVCYAVPEASVETTRLLHFLLNHTNIENPGPAFREQFEALVTTGTPVQQEEIHSDSKKGKKRAAANATRRSSKGRQSSKSKAVASNAKRSAKSIRASRKKVAKRR